MDVRDNDCFLFVEAGAERKFARVFVKQGELSEDLSIDLRRVCWELVRIQCSR